jgi:hypothetical protein
MNFIFKDEFDDYIAHVNTDFVTNSTLNNEQECIEIGLCNAPIQYVMIESIKHRSLEYLRMLSAIQDEYHKREDSDALLDSIMIRTVGGNGLQ